MKVLQLLTASCSLASLISAAALTKRASLTKVSSFGTNPAGLNLYIYVPNNVASSPAIIATLHGASGNAQQAFTDTPYATLAEQYGFIAVYPESPAGAWDATSTKSQTRDGGGASQSIANAVKNVLSTYKGNPAKVFITGVSSGGTMVNTMAATYPDIFKAVVVYSAGSSGNLKNMYPGYTGAYPKYQLYLGSKDTIIGSAAFNTTLQAWAPLLGYDTTVDSTRSNSPVTGWTTYIYGTNLQGVWALNVGHPVPIQGTEDMKWFGLTS